METPDALPCIEIGQLKKDNHVDFQIVSSNIIVNWENHIGIVYYPITSEQSDNLLKPGIRLYALHTTILTEIDKIVISSAIDAAFRCKEYV